MLTARALAFTFPAGFTVGPVDLDLGPGVHRIAGPNGTGKTTLLRVLCADLPRTAGSLEVCGRDPHAEAHARREVALVPARPDLPGFLTVDEAWRNLAALRGRPDWDGEAVRARLDVPGGLPLAHCSAGQRRRAELLAALAGDPSVLLLDETFAHLDGPGCAALVALVEGWRASRCVVMVHHGEPPVPVDSTVELA